MSSKSEAPSPPPPHPYLPPPYLPIKVTTILTSVAIDYFCPLNLMESESGILYLGIWLLLLDSMSEIHPCPRVFQCLSNVPFNSSIVFYDMNIPLFVYLFYCWQTFGLFPVFGCYQQICHKRSCLCSSGCVHPFLGDIYQRWNGCHIGSAQHFVCLALWIRPTSFPKCLYQCIHILVIYGVVVAPPSQLALGTVKHFPFPFSSVFS